MLMGNSVPNPHVSNKELFQESKNFEFKSEKIKITPLF